MEDEVDLSEVFTSLMEYFMQDKFTALPGVVLKVHNQGMQQLVDVQPCVSIKTRDGEVTEQATVLNVPYQQPASSKGGMVFPIKEGDNVLLVFSMRGIDTWKRGTGGLAPPTDYRMFSNQDCIAIPCVFPVTKTLTPTSKHTAGYELGDVAVYNSMGGSMCEIIFKTNGDVIINSPGRVTINCKDSEVNASNNVELNAGNDAVISAGRDTVVTAGGDAVIKNSGGQMTLGGSGGYAQITSSGPLLIKSNEGVRIKGPSGTLTL